MTIRVGNPDGAVYDAVVDNTIARSDPELRLFKSLSEALKFLHDEGRGTVDIFVWGSR